MELSSREEEEGSVAVEDDVFDDEDVGVVEESEPAKNKDASSAQQKTRGSSPPLHLTLASKCSAWCGRWCSSSLCGRCCKHPLLWSAPGKGAFVAYILVFVAIVVTLMLIPDPPPTKDPVWVATVFIFPSCQFLWWAFGIHLFRFLLSLPRYGLDGVDVDQTPIRVSQVDPSIAIFPTDVLCAGAHHPGLGKTSPQCWWWCVVASVVGFGVVCAGLTYQLLLVSCVMPRPYICGWLVPHLAWGTLLAVLVHKDSCKHNDPFVEGIREDQFLHVVAAPGGGSTTLETQWLQDLGIERGEAFQVEYNDNDENETESGNTNNSDAGTVVRYISLKGVTRNNTNLTETSDV